MKKSLSLMSFGVVLSIAACGGYGGSELDDHQMPSSEEEAIAQAEQELAGYHLTARQWRDVLRATAATWQYNSLDAAIADGFVDTGLPCFDGQGYHYIRPDRLNTYDVTKPAILVYSPSGRLVALEWATPVDAVGGVRPVLFGETFHGPVLDPPLFVLHVWNWFYNPSGIFSDTNPRISCP